MMRRMLRRVPDDTVYWNGVQPCEPSGPSQWHVKFVVGPIRVLRTLLHGGPRVFQDGRVEMVVIAPIAIIFALPQWSPCGGAIGRGHAQRDRRGDNETR